MSGGVQPSPLLTQIVEENEKLKTALYQTKNLLDEKAADLKVQREIAEDLKRRVTGANQEYRDLEQKYWKSIQDKDTIERNAKEDFKKLQDLIAKKSREMNEIQAKYLNFVDFDLEQKKIENRLELKYGKEIEDKQKTIDELNRVFNELVRDHEISKARLASAGQDHENAMKILKEAHKKQTDHLLAEISEYQGQRVFNDYRDKYNEAKARREEAEKKTEMLEDELSSIKSELHAMKLKYSQLVVDNAKDVEKLRSETWTQKNEKEKLLYRNDGLEKENIELKEKFSEYEKRITEMANEILNANRLATQREKDIEEVNRRLLLAEEEQAQKMRSLKNSFEDQIHGDKMNHVAQLRNLQEENSRLKEQINRSEQNLRNLADGVSNKDKGIIEAERKVNDIHAKYSTLSSQLKLERENSDRLAMESDDLKRRLVKEETRAKRLEAELRALEGETSTEQVTHIKRVKEEKETRAVREIRDPRDVQSMEESRRNEEVLQKKNAELKDRLKMMNDKLVKAVSEKVLILQKLKSLGFDLSLLDPSAQSQQNFTTQTNPLAKVTLPQDSTLGKTAENPLHQFIRNFDNGQIGNNTTPMPSAMNTGNSWQTADPRGEMRIELQDTTAQYQQPRGRSPQPVDVSSRCPVHPQGPPVIPFVPSHDMVRLPPVPLSNYPQGDKYIVRGEVFQQNAQDMDEDELQNRIQMLLHQKQTFFTNASR
jgi:chromosome segregation ATPase